MRTKKVQVFLRLVMVMGAVFQSFPFEGLRTVSNSPEKLFISQALSASGLSFRQTEHPINPIFLYSELNRFLLSYDTVRSPDLTVWAGRLYRWGFDGHPWRRLATSPIAYLLASVIESLFLDRYREAHIRVFFPGSAEPIVLASMSTERWQRAFHDFLFWPRLINPRYRALRLTAIVLWASPAIVSHLMYYLLFIGGMEGMARLIADRTGRSYSPRWGLAMASHGDTPEEKNGHMRRTFLQGASGVAAQLLFGLKYKAPAGKAKTTVDWFKPLQTPLTDDLLNRLRQGKTVLNSRSPLGNSGFTIQELVALAKTNPAEAVFHLRSVSDFAQFDWLSSLSEALQKDLVDAVLKDPQVAGETASWLTRLLAQFQPTDPQTASIVYEGDIKTAMRHILFPEGRNIRMQATNVRSLIDQVVGRAGTARISLHEQASEQMGASVRQQVVRKLDHKNRLQLLDELTTNLDNLLDNLEQRGEETSTEVLESPTKAVPLKKQSPYLHVLIPGPIEKSLGRAGRQSKIDIPTRATIGDILREWVSVNLGAKPWIFEPWGAWKADLKIYLNGEPVNDLETRPWLRPNSRLLITHDNRPAASNHAPSHAQSTRRLRSAA